MHWIGSDYWCTNVVLLRGHPVVALSAQAIRITAIKLIFLGP